MRNLSRRLVTLALSGAILGGCISSLAASAREPYDVYNYDRWSEAVPSQAGYIAERSVSGYDLGVGAFESPSDIFLDHNGILYDENGDKLLDDHTLVALTIMIAESRPEEKEKIINFLRETTGAEVKYVSGRAPLAVRSDAKELDLLAGVMEKHFGKRPGLTRMHGATDASYFASGSAPVAIIGIKFSGAHAKSERASLSSIEKYSLVLNDLARALKRT